EKEFVNSHSCSKNLRFLYYELTSKNGRPLVRVCELLERASECQYLCLAEARPGDLQPDRHARASEAARDRDSRQAVCVKRAGVPQPHLTLRWGHIQSRSLFNS